MLNGTLPNIFGDFWSDLKNYKKDVPLSYLEVMEPSALTSMKRFKMLNTKQIRY